MSVKRENNLSMGQVESVRFNLKKSKPLSLAADWVEQFLNQLGGDFLLIEITNCYATLSNTRKCPGMCGNEKACDSIERAINTAIKVFNEDMLADLSRCSHDDGDGCQLEIYFRDKL